LSPANLWQQNREKFQEDSNLLGTIFTYQVRHWQYPTHSGLAPPRHAVYQEMLPQFLWTVCGGHSTLVYPDHLPFIIHSSYASRTCFIIIIMGRYSESILGHTLQRNSHCITQLMNFKGNMIYKWTLPYQ
jgi:hypothetical protein